MSQEAKAKQGSGRKPFRPFVVAAHARDNIDFNLNGLQTSKPGSVEYKKYLSWLAKTKLDIDRAYQRAEKLLADLAAERTYLDFRSRSSPVVFTALSNPKVTINEYFNAKREDDIQKLAPENDEDEDEEEDDPEEQIDDQKN